MHNRSILIFNRDYQYLTWLAEQFQQVQFQVKTFHDPHDVIRCLPQQSFDLLILDVIPISRDRIGFLEEIRSIRGNIPILRLTTEPDLQTAILALRLNVSDYLTIPIPFDQLLTRVGEILADAEKEAQRTSIFNKMQLLLDQFQEIMTNPMPTLNDDRSPAPSS